ncbi:sialidase [Haloarcula hispanica]|uniref:Sialidase n=1 Tax=Haloarcula hispanica TaxID=51589 RepID=A0A482TB40_HALHI|nr:sialidase [Haloarcula hispanica]MCJ0619772.1 sialidase [Haloarcula hispanica]RYJ10227.1 sialidase [Haloarcula hispanica]
MERSSIATVLFAAVVVSVASGTAVAAVTGSPAIEVALADNTVSPGEETTLDVVLSNNGELDSGSSTNPSLNSEVTTARGLSVSVSANDAPISVTTSRQLTGDLAAGASQTVSFDVSVDDDADPGSYRVPVKLEYDHYSYVSEGTGARDYDSDSQIEYVTVRISDDATFDIVNVDSSARVGSTGDVELTIRNTGETAATDAAVTLASQNSEFTVGGDEQSSRFVDTWESGENRTFQYRVGASSDAEPEPHNFGLSVAFDNTDGVRTESVGNTVGIAPAPQQSFTVVNTSSTVPVGNTGEYELTLRNDGPVTVNDAAVTVTSQSSDITFGDASSTSQFVGEWTPGEVRTVTVDATASSNSEVRSYTLSASVQYDDPEGDAGTDDSLSLGIETTPKQKFALSDVTGTLRAGQDGTLEATLVNDGPRTVRNAVVNWESDHSNLSPQETQYAVGNLEPGESTTVNFGVDTSDSAREGPRQFDFTVGYADDDGNQLTSDTLSVQSDVAASEDEFDLAVADRTITVGNARVVSVEVTNNLDETVTDIEARLFADDPLSISGADTSYIESLDPGESTTLAFEVSAGSSATAGSTYPMSFDFRYTDSNGNTHLSDTFRKPVDAAPESGGGLPVPLILGLGVVVIGGGAVVYWRRD